MDDDELKKSDDELDTPEEEDLDEDMLLGMKGKKAKGLPEDDLAEDFDPESLEDLAALEDEDDDPYDDVDNW